MKPAILFDCDGVLVDTEPLANEVLSRHMANIGVLMTPDEVGHRYQGHSWPYLEADLAKILGAPLPDDWKEDFSLEFDQLVEKQVVPIPGAPELVAHVAQQGYARAVVSNSPMHHIHRVLRVTGLMVHFDPHLISGEEVANPKPHPDPYLAGAKVLGYEPADCVVIEDSIAGMRAAHAAGMKVYGIGSHGVMEEARDLGVHAVPTMTDMLRYF
ncbi:MAG: HAD family hydrolase [Alphaproteobacteria bacterium]